MKMPSVLSKPASCESLNTISYTTPISKFEDSYVFIIEHETKLASITGLVYSLTHLSSLYYSHNFTWHTGTSPWITTFRFNLRR